MPRNPSRHSLHRIRYRATRANSGSAPVVLAFLKAPRRGFVKTRLAAVIGDAAATKVYRELARRQIAVIPAEWRTEIHYTPRGSRTEMVSWLGSRPHYRLQRGVDLGARLIAAIAQAFRRGAVRVIAVGADCPDLDAACLRTAVARLDAADVVLGPARDGGYYLIGLRGPLPAVFEAISWGTPEVLQQTLARVRAIGAKIALLDEKEDIDDGPSFRRHQKRHSSRARPVSAR
jgi:rSAM/selenodomain-associated transferase 1